MRLAEAYKEMDLSSSATEEEAKKKYKELSKKLHPDINKEPGATEKFKKINEAYECIKAGKDSDQLNERHNSQPFNPFAGFGGFNPFSNAQQIHDEPPIKLSTNISFKESIFGCKKELKYNRNVKCEKCGGEGKIKLNNGCDKCKGNGSVTERKGNMIFNQTCDKCYGKLKTDPCNSCSCTGSMNYDTTVHVNIPGGVSDQNILRLNNMGNFIAASMMGELYSDALLTINVEKSNLKLDGQNVVCELSISLLEALKGCKKTVETVNGDKEIIIKPLSKNNDNILLKKLGVNKIGDQKVILNVNYPENIDKLIEAMQ